MISVSHNTQAWHLRLLAMPNKSFLGCCLLGTLSTQPEAEILEMLPCFWDLVCGLNTFLTASQLQPRCVQELSRGASLWDWALLWVTAWPEADPTCPKCRGSLSLCAGRGVLFCLFSGNFAPSWHVQGLPYRHQTSQLLYMKCYRTS